MIDNNNQPIIPEHNLQKLESFEILDTQPEIEFDLITELASQVFNAPIALISFFNNEKVYIKSGFGYRSNTNLPLNNSLFAVSKGPVKIEDFNSNELTIGQTFELKDQQIRFYVSEPLITAEGFVIGNICAIDFEPKQITGNQLSMFRNLASLVLEKLNNRIFLRNWIKLNDERVHMLIHDLKNPMTTLCLHSELIGKLSNDQEKVINMSAKMNKQSKAVVNSMNEILSSSRTESGVVKMQKLKLNLGELLEKVKSNFSGALKEKSQNFSLNIEEETFIYGDENRLILAFNQLVDNAIKFSNEGDTIQIDVQTNEQDVVISIKDQGQGILSEEINQLFTKFASLSAVSSNYQQSHGLGLSIAKILIDLHKGKIYAESNGRNLGSTFYVSLPIK